MCICQKDKMVMIWSRFFYLVIVFNDGDISKLCMLKWKDRTSRERYKSHKLMFKDIGKNCSACWVVDEWSKFSSYIVIVQQK